MAQPVTPVKSVFKSKTLWFNAVVAVVIALWPIFGPLIPLPPEQAAALVVAGNVLLRFMTKQGLVTSVPTGQVDAEGRTHL